MVIHKPKPPIQNLDMRGEWERFAKSEWGLSGEQASDSFMVNSYIRDLRHLEKSGGELGNFLSQNSRKRMREIGVILGCNPKLKINWNLVEQLKNLIPLGKYAD